MFDPRKLIPFSIEYWSAPIAVMTETTEKTPIVIPNIVRPERSLFTPNEPSAILMISLKRIVINTGLQAGGVENMSAEAVLTALFHRKWQAVETAYEPLSVEHRPEGRCQ